MYTRLAHEYSNKTKITSICIFFLKYAICTCNESNRDKDFADKDFAAEALKDQVIYNLKKLITHLYFNS